MNELIQIDHYLFHLLNEEWTNGLFDVIMPYWRDKMTWIPLYLFAIGFFINDRLVGDFNCVFHNNGRLLYKGEMTYSLREGYGKSYYNNGALCCKGEWKRNHPETDSLGKFEFRY